VSRVEGLGIGFRVEVLRVEGLRIGLMVNGLGLK